MSFSVGELAFTQSKLGDNVGVSAEPLRFSRYRGTASFTEPITTFSDWVPFDSPGGGYCGIRRIGFAVEHELCLITILNASSLHPNTISSHPFDL